MFTKLIKIAAPIFLFAQVASASQLPEHFRGIYTEPSKSKIYGCLGGEDLHTLSLDLINKTYTKIDTVCILADFVITGERGDVVVEDGKIFKILAEKGTTTADYPNDSLELSWSSVPKTGDGHFEFSADNQRVDEFNIFNVLVARWKNMEMDAE